MKILIRIAKQLNYYQNARNLEKKILCSGSELIEYKYEKQFRKKFSFQTIEIIAKIFIEFFVNEKLKANRNEIEKLI